MRDRLHSWLHNEITAPRWVAFLWMARDALLVLGAIVVIVLWWQAATRDEEADRNAQIQSCASAYAATYSSWDSEALLADQHADNIFARLIRASAATDEDPDPALLVEYQEATEDAERNARNAEEMAKRRIGLAMYSGEFVAAGHNNFACPSLPDELVVNGIEVAAVAE